MLAGLDIAGSKPDNLTVFMDAFTGFYSSSGDFVAERNIIDTGDFFFRNLGAGRYIIAGDDDVVGIM